MRRIIDTDPRTFGELFKDLRDEATHLFRREIQLAQAEITEKGKNIARDSKYLAAGAGVGLAAAIVLCLTLTFASIALFALFTPMLVAIWLGPLVLTIALGAVAWLVIRTGLNRLQAERLRPDHTVDSLQENQKWLQEKFT